MGPPRGGRRKTPTDLRIPEEGERDSSARWLSSGDCHLGGYRLVAKFICCYKLRSLLALFRPDLGVVNRAQDSVSFGIFLRARDYQQGSCRAAASTRRRFERVGRVRLSLLDLEVKHSSGLLSKRDHRVNDRDNGWNLFLDGFKIELKNLDRSSGPRGSPKTGQLGSPQNRPVETVI